MWLSLCGCCSLCLLLRWCCCCLYLVIVGLGGIIGGLVIIGCGCLGIGWWCIDMVSVLMCYVVGLMCWSKW